MELFGILFALSIPLLFITGVSYAVYVVYQLFQRRKAGVSLQEYVVNYPVHFSAFVALVLVGFHVGLYWNGGSSRVPALGLAVFTSALALGWLSVYWHKKTKFIVSLCAVLFFSNWGSVFRANGFVQSLNGLVAMASTVLLFVYFVRSFHFTSILSIIETILSAFPKAIKQFFVILLQTIRSATEKKSSHVTQWIKTLSLMLVVSLFFISVLSSADPVFAEIIKTFREELLGRVFWSIVLLFIAAQFLTITHEKQKNEPWHLRYFSERDVITVVGSVLVVGTIFLSVQYDYLFHGSRQLLVNLGLTFSEYVRKGFVEVLVATFAGGIIVYLSALKLRATQSSVMKRITQFGVLALLIELGFFLLSALKRDLLYVEMYGFTRTRIVGGLFLLWLAFFLILLCFFSFRKKFSEGKLALGMFVASCAVWVLLNGLNVDALIAQATPGHHEYTDHFYITVLSEDAREAWMRTVPQLEQATQRLTTQSSLGEIERAELAGVKLAAIALLEKYDTLHSYYGAFDRPEKDISLYEKNNRRWQMWNYSQQQTYTYFTSTESRTPARLKKIRETIEQYQKTNKISLYEEEYRLLYELRYPFVSVRLGYRPSDQFIDDARLYPVEPNK